MPNSDRTAAGLAVSDRTARKRHGAGYPLSRSVASAVFTFWALALILSLAWALVEPRAIFVVLGSAACVIVSVPFVLLRPFQLLSPWTLIVVNVYIGSGARSFFVAGGTDGSRTVDELFLGGRPPGFFVGPGLLYLLGLALLTAGYLLAGRARRKPTLMRAVSRRDFHRGAGFVVLAAAAVGFVAFVLYVMQTGGLSLDRISGKRTTINGLDLAADYSSHGELRVLNGFSAVAFWTQLAFYCSRGLRHGLFTRRGMVLLALFVNACLLPIYASSRAEAVYVIVVGVAIELCFRRRIGIARFMLVSVIVMAVASALTFLRSHDTSRVAGTEASPVAIVLDTFVYSRTFTDIPLSARIIDATPEKLPYKYGETVTGWFAAPIPRSVWPDKPLISTGPEIGNVIFGNERSGVPPGVIAESYWNFGVIGLITWPLLMGWAVRALQERGARYIKGSATVALVYSAVIFRVGIDAVSNSLGYAVFSGVQTAVLVGLVLWFATNEARERMDAQSVDAPSK